MADGGEALGDPQAPAVLLIAGEAGSLWAEVAAALADAGRHVLRHPAATDRAALRLALETMPARPVVVAAGDGAAVAATVLGEGGEHLATALVLVEPGAAPGGDAGAAIRVPTLVVGAPWPGDTIPGAEVAALDAVAAADRADAISVLLLDFLERRVPRVPPEYRAGSDARTLRDALGCFATGVTVVTTRDADGRPVGLTANSFTSVSLDPPLLLVCLARGASSLGSFAVAEGFAVNVLHIGQQAVSGRFATRDADRFADTEWETWDTGAPIIANSLASFDCTRHAWHEAGDHVILVGQVQRVRFEPRRDPLLYFRGRYRRLHFS